jgi:SAM-dependent methyltransferase
MHSMLRSFAITELRKVNEREEKDNDVNGKPSTSPAANSGDARRTPPIRYHIRTEMMTSDLQRTFLQSTVDEETQTFLDQARSRRYVAGWLSDFLNATCLSRTSANALAFRGGMFVLSKQNARRLLLGSGSESASTTAMGAETDATLGTSTPVFDKFLDIGAGDGGVTSNVAPLCRATFATEASKPMQWRLWGRGYEVTEDIEAVAPFDLVGLFNVLDRCDKPWSLLRDMRRWVKPDGTVVMAVVLPWCPFVESGNKQLQPSEQLPMHGVRCADRPPFELCVQSLVDNVVKPAGFDVVRWTRVPYLCEGSASHQYYALDDVVLVMRPSATPPSSG